MTPSHDPDVRIHLRGVHLCCRGCTDAVDDAVAGVAGAASRCDEATGSVTLVARDRAAARMALDAIADAGLHGESDDPSLAMRIERDLPSGMIPRLTLRGVHDCCDLCRDAIHAAVVAVPGVVAADIRPGDTSFEVAGRFSAAELLRSLNAAGFHARVTT